MNLIRKLAVVVVALASSVASADVISLPSNAQRSLVSLNNSVDAGTPSVSNTYTAATDTWALAVPWGVEGDPRVMSFPSSDPVLDLISLFYITALIDEGGNVYGGTFSWIGESSALGLSSPQVLLSGSILGASMPDDVERFFGVRENGFFASVDFVNPAIASRTMAPDFAIISFLIAEPIWIPDKAGRPPGPDWSDDFEGGFVEPLIQGFYVVPEPGTLALLGIGLLGMGLTRRKKTV